MLPLVMAMANEPLAQIVETVKAKISWYYPPLGGPNCSHFVNGVCMSRMASGLPWEDYVNIATACPSSYPFGTKFIVQGREWVCLDRGGKIVQEQDGTIWLDLLSPSAIVSYGTVLDVGVIHP